MIEEILLWIFIPFVGVNMGTIISNGLVPPYKPWNQTKQELRRYFPYILGGSIVVSLGHLGFVLWGW
jgi:hypothetical protein